jgi:hypothetical protein
LTALITGLIKSLCLLASLLALVAISPKNPAPCFSACSGFNVTVNPAPLLLADSNFLICSGVKCNLLAVPFLILTGCPFLNLLFLIF